MIEKNGFYKFDLDIQLETTIDLYEQDRQKHWPETDYERAERFAKFVLTSAEQLVETDQMNKDLSHLQYESDRIEGYDYEQHLNNILDSDLPIEEKKDAIRNLIQEWREDLQSEQTFGLTCERFVIDLARDAVGRIMEGTTRIFKLYSHLLRTHPPKSTQMFLNRLSRCYIWGFEPECVILCRAVLDTVFRDFIPDEICEKHFGTNHRYEFTLSDRIQAALKEGIIDKDTKDLANQVKTRGDKAVHYQPGLTKDIFGTIKDTLLVLKKLNAVKG